MRVVSLLRTLWSQGDANTGEKLAEVVVFQKSHEKFLPFKV